MCYKYAEIPQFSYASFQRQYSAFDYETKSFQFYPVTYSTTDLTEGQNQDNKEPTADEPEKDPTSEDPPAAEPSGNDSPPAEPTGKCMFPKMMGLIIEESMF